MSPTLSLPGSLSCRTRVSAVSRLGRHDRLSAWLHLVFAVDADRCGCSLAAAETQASCHRLVSDNPPGTRPTTLESLCFSRIAPRFLLLLSIPSGAGSLWVGKKDESHLGSARSAMSLRPRTSTRMHVSLYALSSGNTPQDARINKTSHCSVATMMERYLSEAQTHEQISLAIRSHHVDASNQTD